MMKFDRLFDNGKPESCAFAGDVTFLEWLKEIGNGLSSKSGTVVFHQYRASRTNSDFDIGARRRMTHRVLHQIAQRLAYGGGVANEARRLAHLECNMMLGARCQILHP